MPQEALVTIATRHQSHYERLKTSEINKFDSFLKEMDKDITGILRQSDISGFTRQRLEGQLRQVDTLLNKSYLEYEAVWAKGLEDAAIYEADFEARSLGKVVDGVEFNLPSDGQILSAVYSAPLGDIGGAAGGSLLKPFFKATTAAQVLKVQGAIRMGYAQGETTQKIIQRIRGTKAAGFADGIMAGTQRDIETVTRTALQHASSQARQEVWKKNSRVISGVKWISTLDTKTSALCRHLDGQVFPIDEGERPPAHPRCRSSTTAVLKKKFASLSEGRLRSSRDPVTGKVKPVSAKTSYYDWLKKQPASVQNSIVGKSRGKLLRNGGISTERFSELQMGKNFKPLTLVEMKELDPVAFEKAGLGD
jgi:SPP1 gp7 family putative phage head morphogenesis protein